MTSISTTHDDRHQHLVRAWLIAVAALIFAMVVVGGATRLTESGLSITEWQPITGVVPPLTAADWQNEFDKYKAIPQYQALNPGMTLEAFKQIFWWEWGHRLLGRVIGVAFLLPFLWFLWRGWIEPRWRAGLWVIFGLGAVQGAVGWWMVASGLADRTEVSQYRLAFHLTLACALYAAILWTAQPAPAVRDAPARIRVSAVLVLGLVLLQIYLGALVAGLRAGLIYNTWPLMEDHLVPPASQLFFNEPWWRNLFENPMTTQFDHRMTAYALLLAVLLHVWDLARKSTASRALGGAVLLLSAVLLQAELGIQTLLHQAPLPLALLHQATAMLVLTLAVIHARRLAKPAEAEVEPRAPLHLETSHPLPSG